MAIYGCFHSTPNQLFLREMGAFKRLDITFKAVSPLQFMEKKTRFIRVGYKKVGSIKPVSGCMLQHIVNPVGMASIKAWPTSGNCHSNLSVQNDRFCNRHFMILL
ncbi:MAG TPA: hypothetical protein VLL95_08250 [Phnomibacter sp.]|nr:hypothetical protein [Phnomibacter sp.]